jgi:serralysin
VNGVEGFDTVIFNAMRWPATVSTQDGRSEVTYTGHYAVLTEVEALKFIDGTLTVDLNSSTAKIVPMYDTTLDRGHDAGRLKTWVGSLNGGMSLKDIADGFMQSNEFKSKYGSLDDTVVKQLNVNVLGREGETSDVEAWIGGLKGGMSRAEIVTGFSESAENVERSQATVEKGLWITDDHTTQVARLPDAVGLEAWVGGLKGGMTLKQLADGFTGSPEF